MRYIPEGVFAFLCIAQSQPGNARPSRWPLEIEHINAFKSSAASDMVEVIRIGWACPKQPNPITLDMGHLKSKQIKRLG